MQNLDITDKMSIAQDRLQGEATEVISRDERAGHPITEILFQREREKEIFLPYYGDSIVDCGCSADAGLGPGYAGQDVGQDAGQAAGPEEPLVLAAGQYEGPW